MTGTPFHMTRRGAKFYDADVPRLINVLERVADRLAEHALAPVPDTDTEPRERPLTPDQRRALCGPFPVSGCAPCAVDGCDKVAGQAVFCDEHRANVMRYGYAVPCPDTDAEADLDGTDLQGLAEDLRAELRHRHESMVADEGIDAADRALADSFAALDRFFCRENTDAHHVRRGLARAAKLVRAIDPLPDGDGSTAIGRAALVVPAQTLETHAASYGRNK